MTAPTRRPRWKKRRCRLAVAAWLLLPILYVASEGPGLYLAMRGWLPTPAYRAAMTPLASIEPWLPEAVNELRSRWAYWWLQRLD